MMHRCIIHHWNQTIANWTNFSTRHDGIKQLETSRLIINLTHYITAGLHCSTITTPNDSPPQTSRRFQNTDCSRDSYVLGNKYRLISLCDSGMREEWLDLSARRPQQFLLFLAFFCFILHTQSWGILAVFNIVCSSIFSVHLFSSYKEFLYHYSLFEIITNSSVTAWEILKRSVNKPFPWLKKVYFLIPLQQITW